MSELYLNKDTCDLYLHKALKIKRGRMCGRTDPPFINVGESPGK